MATLATPPKLEKTRLMILPSVLAALFGFVLTANQATPRVQAFSSGPPAGYTGAPGEFTCAECHVPPDAGTGQIAITAPQTYVRGQTYSITVTSTNSDLTRQRWGFQLTALDSADEKAGNLLNLDELTQVLNNQGPDGARQYIEHTSAGTFVGQQGGASWTFNWTAPATDVGAVTFYAAGNHANNDSNSSGDYIYFTFVSAAPASTSNPIDDPDFFVRQHYLDFLNREPDTSGLTHWTNEITKCGANAQCVEVKRINVSAAFFLSIEFQQTGYLVYRMYKTAYGDATGTSTLGGSHQLAVPIISLNEFQPDTRQIGQGVVVGQTGWEQQLENNKVAFAADFIARLRFTTAFPTTLTPAQFVDALYATAGVTPSATERTSVINEFGPATNTTDTAARARVLRRVAENTTLAQQDFNRAFVLTQYFGYLGRNPNDQPESNLDYTGYDFWLTKLNQFNGNFIDAEMVKAFISSDEYRHRFGP